MKAKIIAHSILWASLLIATTIMYRHTDSFAAMFSIQLACAATSIAILAQEWGQALWFVAFAPNGARLAA